MKIGTGSCHLDHCPDTTGHFLNTMECYLAVVKKKEIIPFAVTAWMDLC